MNYVFHLERRGQRGPHLRELADRAAVTMTEEMPVEPWRKWTEQLAASTRRPVVAVDTACVVPMQVVGKAHDRAFQFRKATRAAYEQRIGQLWPDAELDLTHTSPDLPFTPLKLSGIDFSDLVGDCEIDHTVGPVPHTPGGSTAGYARWDAFRRNGLAKYAKLRNNPLVERTSRLSPCLHYGMVSPLRIAREADDARTQGAEKFLDELLIWRELAYVFCFYRRDQDSLGAIPAWARETLADHETDDRPEIYAWETLARGKTGDGLWDAAQQSLLIHGELHNNVRMTWGKAVLNWTPDAKSALAMMIDLNHRYALDGRNPASYGGILWCLGQFDRPFPPARPILGTVRDRSTHEHAKRLDTDRYRQQATRPLYEPVPPVAVIGAGMSGLLCARTLLDHGLDVHVFEKGRGVGGRMATRRTTEGPQFDHGAQYFTVRDERLERYVNSWLRDGIVAPWDGRICTLTNGHIEWKEKNTPRFVGIPGMSAICRHLAVDVPIRFGTRVKPAERGDGAWHLSDQDGNPLGEFDYVVTSVPAPQSAELLAAAPKLSETAKHVQMNGCWAMMLSFDQRLEFDFDGAFVHESPISWIARNSSKPSRGSHHEAWVVHASPEWTSQWIDAEPEQVLPQLLDAFWVATGANATETSLATIHRWRHAIPPEPLESRSLFDAELRIGACGDWCSGSRVEGAFLSGTAMAGRILTNVKSRR